MRPNGPDEEGRETEVCLESKPLPTQNGMKSENFICFSKSNSEDSGEKMGREPEMNAASKATPGEWGCPSVIIEFIVEPKAVKLHTTTESGKVSGRESRLACSAEDRALGKQDEGHSSVKFSGCSTDPQVAPLAALDEEK